MMLVTADFGIDIDFYLAALTYSEKRAAVLVPAFGDCKFLLRLFLPVRGHSQNHGVKESQAVYLALLLVIQITDQSPTAP